MPIHRTLLLASALALAACDKAEQLRSLGATPRLDAKAAEAIERTAPGRPERERRLACLRLGEIGGNAARDRLVALLFETTGDTAVDGPIRLYAAAGLAQLRDPGTAIDLLNAISSVNPNDHIGALADEVLDGPYYTVDAQICDALLGMGMWGAEESLVEQMRRKHKIRVLIDAYAVLRRHTGQAFPYRYNGSYADRQADADRWQEWLRATRPEREKAHPFDLRHPRYVQRARDMIHDLGTESVSNQLIAKGVLRLAGAHALPFLREALEAENRIAQRHAAAVVGDIGRPEAVPMLRAALALEDRDARAQVIDALRKVGDRKTAAVARQLADRDAEVRAAAARYLGATGDAIHREPLAAAVDRETLDATATAMRCALLRLGDGAVASRLLETYVSGEQHDRQAAEAALNEAGSRLEASALDSRERRAAAAKRWQPK